MISSTRSVGIKHGSQRFLLSGLAPPPLHIVMIALLQPFVLQCANIIAKGRHIISDVLQFGFDIGKERTEFSEDGSSIRWMIEEVSQLYEVSVCTFPAYEATGVSARRADYDTIQKRKAQAWREGARSKLKKEEK